MKIDLIIGSLQGGGAERVVCVLANYFASVGYEVSVITFTDGDKFELDDAVQRVRLHKKLPLADYSLSRGFFNLLRYYWKKKNRPDVISSHISRVGLVTIPIAKLYGIKVISSEHINHTHAIYNFTKKIIWDFLYKFADAVTILTHYDMEFFKKRSSKVVVMPNPSSFKPLEEQNLSREKVIVAIGSLDRYHHKGLDNLIDIGKNLHEKHPDWKLRIIGEGKVGRQFLEKKIFELGLVDFITLAGYRSDVKDILANSSIFALSSRFEGLPMALIEATSQGIACISYNCVSGPSDIIEDGVNGLLIEDQNHSEMTKGIISLIENEELRRRLGDNAILASQKFSLERVGKQWEDLISNL